MKTERILKTIIWAVLVSWLAYISVTADYSNLTKNTWDTLTAVSWNKLVDNVKGIQTDSSGNVGIGINSGTAKLEVLDTLKLTSTAEWVSFWLEVNDSIWKALQVLDRTNNRRMASFKDNWDIHFWIMWNPHWGWWSMSIIDSTGYVGIGTNSPQANLEIRSITNSKLRLDSWVWTAGVISWYNSWVYWAWIWLFPSTDNRLFNVLWSNGSNATSPLTILRNGNVWIWWTVAPQATLDIEKPINDNGATILNIQSSWKNTISTGTKEAAAIQFQAKDWDVNSSAPTSISRIVGLAEPNWTSSSTADWSLSFETLKSWVLSQSVLIKSDWNVWIGVVSPTAKLEVAWNIHVWNEKSWILAHQTWWDNSWHDIADFHTYRNYDLKISSASSTNTRWYKRYIILLSDTGIISANLADDFTANYSFTPEFQVSWWKLQIRVNTSHYKWLSWTWTS